MYELAVYGFCVYVKMKVLIAQLCLTLCNPVVSSWPGSSVHGILQARILERLPFPSPMGLPNQGSSPDLLHCRQMPREAPNKKAGCSVFCITEGSILPELFTCPPRNPPSATYSSGGNASPVYSSLITREPLFLREYFFLFIFK